jgi:outer membrane protein assembly factor BamB
LLYDGQLYFLQGNDGMLTSVDSKTGKPHYQQERLQNIRGVYASPVGAADRIYLAGREGTTLVLAKGPELKILATNELDDPIDASPVVVGDELLLRTHTHLYCIAD